MGTDKVTTLVEHLKLKLVDFSTEYGVKLIGAIIILIIGYCIARWVAGALKGWLERHDLEPPVKTLFVRVVRLILLLGALMVAVQTIGMNITTMLAGIGVAGVGVGLALQGVLSNLVAGLTIIFTKPYRVGEYIELAGVHGQVKTIELFSTVLTHPDQSNVVIPNRKIVGEILHNYGKIRQLDLSVGVAYGTNTDEAISLLREIVSSNPRVLKDPPPAVGISTLSDSSISIAVKPWTTVGDYGPAGAEIYQAILQKFSQRKINIPYPQREVRLLNNGESVRP
jgi:small conductance mechanosensitive channel